MFNRSLGTNESFPLPDAQDGISIDTGTGLAGALKANLAMEGAKPSVISEHFVLTGNIKAPGALHIEGTVVGDLDVASATIGPKGVLEGRVTCQTLHIRGRFKGFATCRDLFVAATAQVDAEITYHEMSVQQGAGLRGELRVANGIKVKPRP